MTVTCATVALEERFVAYWVVIAWSVPPKKPSEPVAMLPSPIECAPAKGAKSVQNHPHDSLPDAGTPVRATSPQTVWAWAPSPIACAPAGIEVHAPVGLLLTVAGVPSVAGDHSVDADVPSIAFGPAGTPLQAPAGLAATPASTGFSRVEAPCAPSGLQLDTGVPPMMRGRVDEVCAALSMHHWWIWFTGEPLTLHAGGVSVLRKSK
ncbi:MAG: hypothetical protein M5T61_07905 [Acidimicrobiia bacterium]|nr:hypothetical protein [Acidimicrobiia bacterium]